MDGRKVIAVYFLFVLFLIDAQSYDQADGSALISSEKSNEQSTTSKPADYQQSGSKEIAKEDYNKVEASYEHNSKSVEKDQTSIEKVSTTTTSYSRSSSVELNSADWSKSSESTTTQTPISYAQRPPISNSNQQRSQPAVKHPYVVPLKSTQRPIIPVKPNAKSQSVPAETYGSAPKIVPSFSKKPVPSTHYRQIQAQVPTQKQNTRPQSVYKQNSPQQKYSTGPQLNKARVVPSGYSQQNRQPVKVQQRPSNQLNQRPIQTQASNQQVRLPIQTQSSNQASYQQRPPHNNVPQKYALALMGNQGQRSQQNYNWATMSQRKPQMGNSNQRPIQNYKTSNNQKSINYQLPQALALTQPEINHKVKYQGNMQNRRPINSMHQQSYRTPQIKQNYRPINPSLNNGMQKWQQPKKSNYQVVQSGYSANKQQPKGQRTNQSATTRPLHYTTNSVMSMAMNQRFQPRRNDPNRYIRRGQRPIQQVPMQSYRIQPSKYTPFQQANFKSTTYRPTGYQRPHSYRPSSHSYRTNPQRFNGYRPASLPHRTQPSKYIPFQQANFKSTYRPTQSYNHAPVQSYNRPRTTYNHAPASQSYRTQPPIHSTQSYHSSPYNLHKSPIQSTQSSLDSIVSHKSKGYGRPHSYIQTHYRFKRFI